MKFFTKHTILLYALVTSLFILNGCSSYQRVTHLYNDNFGVVPSAEVDQIIEEETLASSYSTEIDTSMLSDDPSLTTELIPDPEAVTLENYVYIEPVITYKYMDSPNFYTEDELPDNKLQSTH